LGGDGLEGQGDFDQAFAISFHRLGFHPLACRGL
jgi:hypothetical protein